MLDIAKLKGNKTLWAMATIVLVGGILRFWDITSVGLSAGDVGVYIRTATWMVGAGGTPMAWEPPLYPLMLAASFLVFGVHDFVAAGTSALLGTISIILIYFLGRELYGNRVGIIAALFLAVTEFHIVYSRIVLPDVALAMSYLLAFLFFAKALKTKSLKWYIISGLLIAGCMVVKNTGVHATLIVISFFAILSILDLASGKLKREKILVRLRGLIVIFIMLAAILSVWIYMIGIGVSMSPDDATHFRLSEVNFGSVVANSPQIFYGGLQKYIYIFSIHSTYIRTGTLSEVLFQPYAVLMWFNPLVSLLFVFSCYMMLKRRKWEDVLVLTWFFFILLFYTLGVFIDDPRYILGSIPVFCIIAAKGTDIIKSKNMLVGLLLVIAVTGVLMSANSLAVLNDGFRETGTYLHENVGEDELIIHTGMPQILFYHEVDTGNWWERGDEENLDKVRWVVLEYHKYNVGTTKYFDFERFEEDFDPVMVFEDYDASIELRGNLSIKLGIPDYYDIKVYHVDRSIKEYFNY